MKSRDELAQTRAHGIVAELGVAAGNFSEVLLNVPDVKKVYSIDAWCGDRPLHNDNEFKAVLRRFEKYGEKSVVMRRTFEYAVVEFNQIFDFIYLDGYAHTGQGGLKTLMDWWDRLKPGGVFAGHDYAERWLQTKAVVHQFVHQKGLKFHITGETECMEKGVYPSWYIYKKAAGNLP